MRKLTPALAAVALLLLLLAAPIFAAGPGDGIWFVVQSNPQRGVFQFYTSFHQNGATVVVINAYGTGAGTSELAPVQETRCKGSSMTLSQARPTDGLGDVDEQHHVQRSSQCRRGGLVTRREQAVLRSGHHAGLRLWGARLPRRDVTSRGPLSRLCSPNCGSMHVPL
jgi:hypothetical protein